jgi:DNA-binding GntR family transcriptional regulator
MGLRSSSRITPAHLASDVIPFPSQRTGGEDSGQESQTLHRGVLTALRDLIIHSELPPGIRLTETVLCERLKVSRTPLREALKVLAHEGLVEILPNRGARVVRLELENVKHLFELIASLESFAGRLACERIKDAEICDIKAIHYQMEASFLRLDLPDYFRLNQLIHRRIVEAADNPVLAQTHENLNARLLRARYLASQTDRNRWAAAMREHECIVDALSRRAWGELAELLQEHLWHKYETIRANFDRL